MQQGLSQKIGLFGLMPALVFLLLVMGCGAENSTIIGNPDDVDMRITGAVAINDAIFENGEPTSITSVSNFLINNSGDRLYVLDYHEKTLSVFNIATNTIDETVDVASEVYEYNPIDMAIDPEGSKIYIGYSIVGDSISVFETSTNAIVGALPLGLSDCNKLIVSPDSRFLYISSSPGIMIVDIMDGKVIDTITDDDDNLWANSLAVSPDGATLYAGEYGTVHMIDTESRKVVNSVESNVEGFGGSIAVAPDGAHIYVTSAYSGIISVLDPSTGEIVSTVDIGTQLCFGISVSPDGKYVFYTGFNSIYEEPRNVVGVFDTTENRIRQELILDDSQSPSRIQISPDGSKLYVIVSDYTKADNVVMLDSIPQSIITIDCTYNK